MNVLAVVLAAGASRRFGSPKLLAALDGRPILEHVLDAAAEAGLMDVVVVLGEHAAAIRDAVTWRMERIEINPRPGDGLSSSLRIGLDAAAEDRTVDAVLVLLGDQPAVRPDVIRAVLAAAEISPQPIVRVRYADDEAPNPVLVRRAVWALAAGLSGDRGLSPLLVERADLVAEVAVPGTNPDIDTPEDLARVH
ncbi:MAG: nucleotidyltransferase family protein [Candidatus Limnocylindrales bacterium]